MAENQSYVTAILSREDHFRAALGTQRDFGSWWAQTKAWVAKQVREIDYGKVSLVEIIGAYTDAAKNGLMIDGEECMVMIRGRNDKAKMRCEIGAKGVVRKAGQAGILIQARTIHENDTYDFDEGEGWIRHRRALKDRGEAVAYYAVATYKDGRKVVRILDVDQAQKRSTGTGAWKTWFNEMGEKSAILTMRKVLYFGDELENMLAGVSTWAGEPEAEDVGGPGVPGATISDKVAAAAERQRQDRETEGPVHEPDESEGEAGEDGQEPQEEASEEASQPPAPKNRSQGRSRRQSPREEEQPPPPSDDDCPI